MATYKRLLSAIEISRLVSLVGLLLMVGFVTWALTRQDLIVADMIQNVFLVVIPAFMMLYVGYWLPRSSLHPDTHVHVAKWLMRGMASLNFVLVLVALLGGLENGILEQFLLLTSIGGTAGLGVGINQAKAYTKTRELEEQKQKLEDFNSLLSHDLKNPLINAIGYIQVARDTREKEDLQTAEESIKKAIRILEEVSAIPVTPEDLDKKDKVRLERAFKQAHDEMESEVDYNVEDTAIHASRPNLVRLLSKLIENSIQHNEKQVKIEAGPMEDGFYYEDNGKGMQDEDKSKILERGYTSEGGQGIGLYVVKRIVDAHEWHMEMTESSEGGARFEFHT